MYFFNRGVPGKWDWLAKGLADMLITDLSKTDQLQLVERERLQSFLKEMDLSAVGLVDSATAVTLGRVAKADKVLFGSFRITETNIEIEAHLVEVATGNLERVEWVRGRADAIFALEKELAFKVVANLHLALTQRERESLAFQPTASIDAAAHYYQGVDHFDRGRQLLALRETRSALNADRGFTKAGLLLGQAYDLLGAPAHAALALDRLAHDHPDAELAYDALWQLALIRQNRLQDNPGAIRVLERLLERYPNGGIAEQSIRETRSVAVCMRIAELLEKEGRYRESFEYYEKSLNIFPFERVAYHGFPGKSVRRTMLRLMLKAYRQTGSLPLPLFGVIPLAPGTNTYSEDYATRKRLVDAFSVEEDRNDPTRLISLFRLLQVPEITGKALKPEMIKLNNPVEGQVTDGTPMGGYLHGNTYKTTDKYVFAAPEGYRIETISLNVTAEGAYRVDVQSLPLRDDINAPDVSVPFVGKLPWRNSASVRYSLPPGINAVQLTLDAEGKIHDWIMEADVVPLGDVGMVEIKSDPPDAEVYIDGPMDGYRARYGYTPCILRDLPVGKHRVNVSFDHGRELTFEDQEVLIEKGKTVQLFFKTREKSRLPVSSQEATQILGPEYGDNKSADFQLIKDREGRFHIIGKSKHTDTSPDKLWIASSPDGLNWNQPRELPPAVNALSGSSRPFLLALKDGRFLLEWSARQGDHERRFVSWSDDLEHWTDRLALEEPTSYGKIIQLSDGLLLKFTGRLVASEDGQAWSPVKPPPAFLESTSFLGQVDMIEDDHGRWVLAFSTDEKEGEKDRAHLYTETCSFPGDCIRHEHEQVAKLPAYVTRRFIRDSAGRFVLSWCLWDSGVSFAISPDAERWSEPQRVLLPIRATGFYDIAQHADGDYLICWANKAGVWVSKLSSLEGFSYIPSASRQLPQSPAKAPVLCVAPFTNRTPGTWDWLADGISDMVLTDVRRAGQLQLVIEDSKATTSILRFEWRVARDQIINISKALELGRKSGATHVLFGSYLKQGTRVEIEPLLLDVSSGEIHRLATLAGPAEKVITLIDRLSRQVHESFAVNLPPERPGSAGQTPAKTTEAAAHFYAALGLYFGSRTPLRSLREARMATRADPTAAAPVFLVADRYRLLKEFGHALVEYERLASLMPEVDLAHDAAYQTENIFEMLGNEPEAMRLLRGIALNYVEREGYRGTWGDREFSFGYGAVFMAEKKYLKRNETAQSIDFYFSILDAYPGPYRPDSIEGTYRQQVGSIYLPLVEKVMDFTNAATILNRRMIHLSTERPTYVEDYSTDKRKKNTILLLEPQSGAIGEAPGSGTWEQYLVAAPAGRRLKEITLSITYEGECSFTLGRPQTQPSRFGRWQGNSKTLTMEKSSYRQDDVIENLFFEIRTPDAAFGRIRRWELTAILDEPAGPETPKVDARSPDTNAILDGSEAPSEHPPVP